MKTSQSPCFNGRCTLASEVSEAQMLMRAPQQLLNPNPFPPLRPTPPQNTKTVPGPISRLLLPNARLLAGDHQSRGPYRSTSRHPHHCHVRGDQKRTSWRVYGRTIASQMDLNPVHRPMFRLYRLDQRPGAHYQAIDRYPLHGRNWGSFRCSSPPNPPRDRVRLSPDPWLHLLATHARPENHSRALVMVYRTRRNENHS